MKRRIFALMLAVVLVISNLGASRAAAEQPEAAGESVTNTFEEEGTDFSGYWDGNGKYNISNNVMPKSADNDLFGFNALVETGTGENGGAAMKITNTGMQDHTWPSAFLIYDKAESGGFQSFVPKANTSYKISVRYKVAQANNGNWLQIRLRETYNNAIFVPSSNIKELGMIAEEREATDGWATDYTYVTTGNSPEPWYIAVTTEDADWWQHTFELYIDSIEITEKTEPVYEPSSELTNAFDEARTNFKTIIHDGKNAISNAAMPRSAEGLFSQYSAWVEAGAGEDGGAAMKITTSKSYKNQWPSSFLIYDQTEDGYRTFVPKANTSYRISVRYKVAKTNNDCTLQIRLRETVDGAMQVEEGKLKELGTIAEEKEAMEDWATRVMYVTTGDNPTAWYIAVTTEDSDWWQERNHETYIDSIRITEKTEPEYEPSSQLTNTFDEAGTNFKPVPHDGSFTGTSNSAMPGSAEGYFSQFDAWVEAGAGEDGGAAMKIADARGYEYKWPSAFLIYDHTEDGYRTFVPKANTSYRVSVRYKVAEKSGGHWPQIRLRETFEGSMQVDKENIKELGIIAEEKEVTDGWETDYAYVTTGANPTAWYIAVTTEDPTWYCDSLEMYIDRIEITEKTEPSYEPSAELTNAFDEAGTNFKTIVYDNQNAISNHTMPESAEGLFSQYNAWVEAGAGEDGGAAMKITEGKGYEYKWPSAFLIYDRTEDGYRTFVPKANTSYRVSVRYKVAEKSGGHWPQIRLRETYGDSMCVDKENIKELGIIAEEKEVTDGWETDYAYVTTGANPTAWYIAVTTEDPTWYCDSLELYIDHIEITEKTEPAYEPSAELTNTFDEAGTNFKTIVYDNQNAISNHTMPGSAEGLFSQYNAWVEAGAGEDGGAAMKITEGKGYEYKWPSAFLIYDHTEDGYRTFVPKANTSYQVSVKYKVAEKSGGHWPQIRLRETYGDSMCVDKENIKELGIIAEEKEVTDGWATDYTYVTTGDNPTAWYIAITTEDPEWYCDSLELYIDHIEITEKTEPAYEPSAELTNTFDEAGTNFKTIVYDNQNAISNHIMPRSAEGLFSQYSAWVEAGAGENGGAAMKITDARGYGYKWPSAFLIYDKTEDGYRTFVPKANTSYQISVRYKVAETSSGHWLQIRLRETFEGSMQVDQENIRELGILADGKEAMDNWATDTAYVTTGANPTAWYIAVTTEDPEWWSHNIELYIDRIEIREKTKPGSETGYEPSAKLTNTFDEAGTNFKPVVHDGKFKGTSNSAMPQSAEKLFSQFDAWVEAGAGEDGGAAMKIADARGYEYQWPSAFLIYDKTADGYHTFVPKANTSYRISVRYKVAEKSGIHWPQIRLRETYGDSMQVEKGNIRELGIVADEKEVTDGWATDYAYVTTGANPTAWYIAVTTEDPEWYCDSLEMYIDRIEITEKTEPVYEPSAELINTFDETGTNFKPVVHDERFKGTSNSAMPKSAERLFSQFDAWVEAGAGENGKAAMKIADARGYEYQWPSAFLIYDRTEDGYRTFVPKANTSYRISVRYKVAEKSGIHWPQIRLRETYGESMQVEKENIRELGIIADEKEVTDGWATDYAYITTGANPTAWYIAVTTEDPEWYCDSLEMYIDRIEITEKTEPVYEPSAELTNTYDEAGTNFKPVVHDERFKGTSNSAMPKSAERLFSQFDAWVEAGAGEDGGAAMKIADARGYGYKWPSAFLIYDRTEDGYRTFVPKANTSYRISVRYKVAEKSGIHWPQIRLRETYEDSMQVDQENIRELGIIADEKGVTDGWATDYAYITTGANPTAWYIAVTTEDPEWYCDSLEMYIDRIEIREKTEPVYEPSAELVNTYDEAGTNFEPVVHDERFKGTSNSAMPRSAERLFSQFDAWVEPEAGKGGKAAMKIADARGYGYKWPCAFLIYDHTEDGYRTFVPKANMAYQISVRYKVTEKSGIHWPQIRLRETYEDSMQVDQENIRELGVIADEQGTTGGWVTREMYVVAGDNPTAWYIAVTTEDPEWYCDSLEMYIDRIEIKECADEGVVGRPWSGKIATRFAGGSGTAQDPYRIETPEQLARAILIADGSSHDYYKLSEDIKINDTSGSDWMKNARNWLLTRTAFTGHFNGNGHIVSGLYYHIDGTATYVGLFPIVGANAVIEKVGVVESYLYNQNADSDANGAAIVGFVEWMNDEKYEQRAIIRQCFADDSVTVEAKYAGGIVGGAASAVHMENCYFTGTISGEKYGSLIGDGWNPESQYHTISHCYVSTAEDNPVVGNIGFQWSYYDSIYSNGTVPKRTMKLPPILMYGEYAKEYMEGFDFEKVWKTVKGGTPVLKVFNSDAYSSKRAVDKVKVEFVSMGGSECEAVYGYPRVDEMPKLPTPEKRGYRFEGWYHSMELDLPCRLEAFPDYDTHLYAKWEPLGFTVDFEGTYDEKYDYNDGVEHFAPGVAGYLPKYVYQKIKSMHCKGTEEEGSVFLLSYENKLEVGEEYEMDFWVYTEDKDASGTMDLIHTKYPDVNASAIGYEEAIEFSDMEEGQWKQYTVTFTANAPYMLIQTSKGTNVYFDNISVIPTGNTGKTGDLAGMLAIVAGAGGNIGLITAITGGVIVLIGGGIAIVTLAGKKRKKAAMNE